MRGFAAPEALICYERAESLCHSLNRPLILYLALIGQWRYSLITDKLSAALGVAQRVYSLAKEQNDSAVMIGAYRAFAGTHYWLGDFETARQNAMRGIQLWRAGGGRVLRVSREFTAPAVACLIFRGPIRVAFREVAPCHATMAEAISLAKELNDMHAISRGTMHAGSLAYYERNAAEVGRLASDVIELSTRQTFALWLAGGEVLRGWARSASGDTTEGISWIGDGIRDYRATGSTRDVPFLLALKAEALYLAGRTSEALDAIMEAEALVE